MRRGSPETGPLRSARSFEAGRIAKRLAVGLVALFAVVELTRGGGASRDSAPFRIAFSSGMYTDVNENDAKVAVKLWGQISVLQSALDLLAEHRRFCTSSRQTKTDVRNPLKTLDKATQETKFGASQ